MASISNWVVYPNSFKGSIEGIDDIYVDNFEDKNKRFYFLSHMHSDHFGGLMVIEDKDLINSDAIIFMTEESRLIYENKFRIFYKKVEDQIVTLDVSNREKIGDNTENEFYVTFIPVEHMVGAVMFLFETGDKTILYTGDFVIKAEDLRTLTLLHDENGNPIKIDLLYYDATFRDIPFLPEREQCTLEILEKMEEWLNKNDTNAVGLYTNYDFAYENLYEAIYEKFQKEIYLSDSYLLETYNALSVKQYSKFKVSGLVPESRIHICSTKHSDLDMKHNECGCFGNSYNYKKFYISAMCWKDYEPGQPTVQADRWTVDVMNCCYPTHCSKKQLDEFIAHFSPIEAVPFFKGSHHASCETPLGKRPTSMAVTPVKRANDCELEPFSNPKRHLPVYKGF